jgi:multiple sugar transport system permease protein
MAQHTATIANPPQPARPTRARRRLKELRPLLWFVSVLLLLLTVTLYPTLFVVWMSFQKTRYYDLAGFVGLANYVDTLSSRAFWETTYTSLVYMAGSLVLSLGLGVLAALVLNNLTRGGAVLRVLTLVPWTLSMAVVGTIWLWLFNPPMDRSATRSVSSACLPA